MKFIKTFYLLLLFVPALFGHLTFLAQAQEERSPAQTLGEESRSQLATTLSAINIPARGGLCFFSSLLGGLVMVISGGTRYVDAAQMIEESCSGPWVITEQMLAEGLQEKKVSSPDQWAGQGLPLR